MCKPTFFVIGAPKCGTTALYEYLRTHPNVFMPQIKEPHYFAADFPAYRTIHSEGPYLALFSEAEPEQTAVGEASVFYLFSQVAVGNILDFNRNARLVVMLRNPVDLVQSLHSQFLYGFREDERDFRKAWDLQSERRAGRRLPRFCLEPSHLQYASVARLGRQVQRLLSLADREQIQFILLEDLQESPAKVYAALLSFLGVAQDGRKSFPAFNQNRAHRSEFLARFLMRPPFPLSALKSGLKKALRLQNTRVSNAIYGFNQRRVVRNALDVETRVMLTQEFAEDVELLEDLIQRDLRRWKGVTSAHANPS
jgi:hypothetical protein